MSRNIWQNVIVYGTAHAIVDCISVGVLFTVSGGGQALGLSSFGLVVLYIILAFGLQAVVGIIVDQVKAPKMSAMVGVIVVVLSILAMSASPVIAVVLAGIGNAIFHVGGGIVSLSLTPRKATAPGLFVAPGALGLLAGTLLGKFSMFNPVLFLVIAIIVVIAIWKTDNQAKSIIYIESKPAHTTHKFEIILCLVLFAVVVRAYVGMIMVFPWKTNMTLLLVLTFAVFLGKALGGILADKFGWNRVAVGALLVSAPLLAFWSSAPWVAIIGMFLFNITMPVTLVTTSNLLPKHAGFAFGLTCFALFLGTLPIIYGWEIAKISNVDTLFVIIVSAVVLFLGLRMYGAYEKTHV